MVALMAGCSPTETEARDLATKAFQHEVALFGYGYTSFDGPRLLPRSNDDAIHVYLWVHRSRPDLRFVAAVDSFGDVFVHPIDACSPPVLEGADCPDDPLSK